MLPLSRYVGFDVRLRLVTGGGNPKDCNCLRSEPASVSGSLFPAACWKLAGLHDLDCSTLGSYRDHSKQAVCIIVWARCKEELVVCAVRVPGGILAKLQCPNIVHLNRLALRVAKWAEKLTRRRIERVDPASGNVVTNENRINS